jgi:hypothetical protein
LHEPKKFFRQFKADDQRGLLRIMDNFDKGSLGVHEGEMGMLSNFLKASKFLRIQFCKALEEGE